MLEVTTIVMMILIFGTIWGGLGYFVNRAYKREKRTSKGS
jgi:hypothetical protein